MKDLDSILQYVPTAAKSQIKDYLDVFKITVHVTAKRVTKHGDFRVYPDGSTRITINEMSNPYRFLITLVHELAHFDTFKTYYRRVKPHGVEWKQKFQLLMLPLLNPSVFPEPLLSVLAHHLKNPKASSDSDLDLVMSLKKYDADSFKIYVFELDHGTLFSIYNGRQFLRGKKRVKRYECKEVKTGRIYLFSPYAEVTKINS